MNFDALKATTVNSQIAINGADATPSTTLIGPIAKFEETHSVKDASGKSANVYVKVVNAPSGLTYNSKVLPREGTLTSTQSQVSAEQWLTVPMADSIKCTATSSYGTARSASVGLEEAKSTVAGDYVTLSGYYGKAVTIGTSVLASQTATSGAANSIKIYGTAKDSSGTCRVNTPLKGISGGRATFTGLSETSSAGTATQITQKVHVHGTFISTATYTSATNTATTNTATRTTNYGTDYDLNMMAKKTTSGPTVYGILGYYVNPTMKIQGAVNAAQSGDTINVASGTYKENIVIDKSLTINGASRFTTFVYGNKLRSVFKIGTVNPNIDVTLSGLGITGGSATDGGGVYNRGKATIKNCFIFANSANYGGGVYNYWGGAKISLSNSIISGNTATNDGGGIWNYGTATISGSTISGNSATYGGGVYNDVTTIITDSIISGNTATKGGGGIWNYGTATISGSTISGNTATNDGGGIRNYGTATISGSTISGNSAQSGGGFSNVGTATISDSTIYGNSASSDGAGMNNLGIATLKKCEFYDNHAGWSSGAINNAAKLRIDNCYIHDNSAKIYGGAIDNTRGGTIGSLTVTNSRITANTNTGGMGGGITNHLGCTLNCNPAQVFGNIPNNIYQLSVI